MKPDLDLGDSQLILKECRLAGLSRNQSAYLLATVWWETAHTMKPVKEAYWIKNAESWRKKNLRYWPWFGRGYVQLTWMENYKRAGQKLGLDLTTDPDVVMKPNVSAKILVLGSLEGWFTGKKLGDYINTKRCDFKGARRIINGRDKASQIATIAKAYDHSLMSVGHAISSPEPANTEHWISAFLKSLVGKS
jgi:putative chitinase